MKHRKVKNTILRTVMEKPLKYEEAVKEIEKTLGRDRWYMKNLFRKMISEGSIFSNPEGVLFVKPEIAAEKSIIDRFGNFRIQFAASDHGSAMEVVAPCGHKAIVSRSANGNVERFSCPNHRKEGVLKFLHKTDRFVWAGRAA